MTNKMFHTTTRQRKSLNSLLHGPHSTTWNDAVTNELGRLAQGIYNTKGNNVIAFIIKSNVPSDRIVTYANMVCDYIPHKEENYRVRLTVGGNLLPYSDDDSSPAAFLLETKLLLNSTISDTSKGARFITLDIKDYS